MCAHDNDMKPHLGQSLHTLVQDAVKKTSRPSFLALAMASGARHDHKCAVYNGEQLHTCFDSVFCTFGVFSLIIAGH